MLGGKFLAIVVVIFVAVVVLDLDALGLHAPGEGGLRPGEELLPEEGSADAAPAAAEAAAPQADAAVVAQRASMGFPELRCQKAALATQNAGSEPAMNWLLEQQ